MYKMVDVGVKKITDAESHTITVGNRKLFWVKIYDVQKNQVLKTYLIYW